MILTLYLINLYNIFFDFKVRKNTYPKKACNYKKVCKKMFIDNIKKLNYTLRCSLLQNQLIKSKTYFKKHLKKGLFNFCQKSSD